MRALILDTTRRLFLAAVGAILARFVWHYLTLLLPRWAIWTLSFVALDIFLAHGLGVPSLPDLVVELAQAVSAAVSVAISDPGEVLPG